ncbi:MAG: rod shape-determining protein MreC [Deltaproteobacteria bacterium]|nr:rod shape-determining protein MreC [Deltaproteobacteria bacterium]
MLIPRKYHSLVVAALLLLIALAVLSYSATRISETGLLRKLVLEAAAPVEGAINVSLNNLHDVWKRYLFLVGLEDENRRLLKENAVLNEQLNRYREDALEGERLRTLLDMKEAFQRKAVTARVVDSHRASVFKTILIDKGTAAGLRVGLPVLSHQGVVGRIIETSWQASRVLLMNDENSNIDALIQRSRTQGILQGAGSAGCTLKYISRAEEVQTGDVVLSSGLAGVFPKGLRLGVVTGVSRKEGGLFQKIDVAPAVDFGKLEEVLIPIMSFLPTPNGGKKP